MDLPLDINTYCTLYLIRHGETEWNVKRLIQGHADSPLTALGIAQVTERANALADVHFDAVFSSDSARAVQTAEIIKLDREIVVQASHLLRERSHGQYEGLHYDEYHVRLKDKLAERDRLPLDQQETYKIDDIESDAELMSRVILQLREIALAYPSKTVAVVTHGGCLYALLVRLGYATRKELTWSSIKNAACVTIRSDGVNFFVGDMWGVHKI